MTDNKKSTQVAYCPHCGNTSVQIELLTQRFTSTFYEVQDGTKSHEPSKYLVARCETCTEILVYLEHDQFAGLSDTDFGDLEYPKQSAFTDAVPENIRKFYKEAVSVKNASPTAFVILARRVLEEICLERGITERNLATGLQKLAESNVIPKTLSEATKLIRLVGNAGAHASSVEITPPQVWAVDDFIKAIIEYMYVAPKKIEDFKERFSKVVG